MPQSWIHLFVTLAVIFIWKRLTTGIQLRQDAFNKVHYDLLTILGVTEILCNFRLVQEGKQVKRYLNHQNEFAEKFSVNYFALKDAQDNTSRLLNRGGIVDLPLLRILLAICQKSREPSFWEVVDSLILLAYVSLAASRTLLEWFLACLNFTLDFEDLCFWYNRNQWFLWAMVAAQAAENYQHEWDLTSQGLQILKKPWQFWL